MLGDRISQQHLDRHAGNGLSAGNRTMHKGKSRDRIDGAAATWMAVSRAAASEMRSFYDFDAFTEDMASF